MTLCMKCILPGRYVHQSLSSAAPSGCADIILQSKESSRHLPVQKLSVTSCPACKLHRADKLGSLETDRYQRTQQPYFLSTMLLSRLLSTLCALGMCILQGGALFRLCQLLPASKVEMDPLDHARHACVGVKR